MDPTKVNSFDSNGGGNAGPQDFSDANIPTPPNGDIILVPDAPAPEKKKILSPKMIVMIIIIAIMVITLGVLAVVSMNKRAQTNTTDEKTTNSDNPQLSDDSIKKMNAFMNYLLDGEEKESVIQDNPDTENSYYLSIINGSDKKSKESLILKLEEKYLAFYSTAKQEIDQWQLEALDDEESKTEKESDLSELYESSREAKILLKRRIGELKTLIESEKIYIKNGYKTIDEIQSIIVSGNSDGIKEIEKLYASLYDNELFSQYISKVNSFIKTLNNTVQIASNDGCIENGSIEMSCLGSFAIEDQSLSAVLDEYNASKSSAERMEKIIKYEITEDAGILYRLVLGREV